MINLHSHSVMLVAIQLREELKLDPTVMITDLFEKKYNCKIIPASDDPWCLSGHVEFNEEKHQTWFLLQFGGQNE